MEKFRSFEAIKNADFEELTDVEDIGAIVANNVIEFFRQEKIVESIEELFRFGVKPYYEEKKEAAESIFNGKTVVVTGSLEGYSRTGIKDKLEGMGGDVSGSVSKNTDYVIVGSDPGSKYEKAQKLGIRVIGGKRELKSYLK